MDGVEIQDQLTITQTQISGTILLDGGPHSMTITIFDGTDAQESATVDFNVDMGKIDIVEPEPGAEYNKVDIPILVNIVNMNAATIHVELQKDGGSWVDYTGDVTIGSDTITGELLFLSEGDYNLHIWGTHPNHVDPDVNPDGRVEDYSFFTVELIGAHFEIQLDTNTITAPGEVNVDYQVFNAAGVDVTGETAVSWSVVPAGGVTINEAQQKLTFVEPGFFELKLSANVTAAEFIEGSAFIWVNGVTPGSVEVELNTNQISAGDFVFATATAYDENDVEIPYTQFVWTTFPTYGVTVLDGGNPAMIEFTRAGTYTVRATAKGTGIFGEAQLTVEAGDPFAVDLILPDPVINEGEFTTPVVFIVDQYGNPITTVSADITVFPTTGVVMDSPAAGDITFNDNGAFSVTGTAESPWDGLHDTETLTVIDATAPQIEIWTPERGLWVNDEAVQVHGIVNGCDYLNDTIQYSGDPLVYNLMAPPSECQFDASIPLQYGLNIIEITVTEFSSGLDSTVSRSR
ncbi:MAG: hypothetical protein M5R36_28160 [Deltaproteobacteria bacterium]|nr:hypothetical protein [Deltaproteobacteria bacterium]